MTAPSPRLDPGGPARELLAAVEQQFDEAGRDLPKARYLLAGNAAAAAWDCPHVSVSLNSVQPGASASSTRQSAGAGQVGQVMMPRGVYEVRILRDWPAMDDDGDPPDPDVISAASQELMLDAGLITQAIYAWAGRDRTNREMRPGEIQPLGPLGALAGYSCVVTISPIQ